MSAFTLTRLRLAVLSPIAWRTPPRHYGPWEQIASWITEGMVRRGAQVTLFATQDSITTARLHAVAPSGYEESAIHAKAWECLHISELYERAAEFDLIHNHFDFLPLTYSQLVKTPMLTTIHGFSSPDIVPVYRKYNGRVYYVSISDAHRHPDLDYIATVRHGIDLSALSFHQRPEDYLLFFGRVSHDKGTYEAIQVARTTGSRLIIAGITPEKDYFEHKIKPLLDGKQIVFVGSVGPAERDKLLGGARALLHLINFDEPFGLSVAEALACGTPVIAMERGSMPELIVPGQTGFLVHSLAEAVAAVGKVASLDRQACRQYAEAHFTVEQMVDGYVAVYRQILEHPTSFSDRQ